MWGDSASPIIEPEYMPLYTKASDLDLSPTGTHLRQKHTHHSAAQVALFEKFDDHNCNMAVCGLGLASNINIYLGCMSM